MSGEREARLEAERGRLFALAYRMLGSAADAEDILQEASVRYVQATATPVRDARAYLTTIVTRLCLDHLKSAAARRESYVGPWLPEPVFTSEEAEPGPSERVSLGESVTLAFLLLLDTLKPAERGVFLLHEVFDYTFAEVAGIMGKTEASCRQAFRRASEHVRAGRVRDRAPPGARQELLGSFLRACATGDLPALEKALAADVTLWSDGGGKVSAARKPVFGRNAVARFLLGVMRKAGAGAWAESTLALVNGEPAVVARGGGRAGVLVLDIGPSGVRGLRSILNPDKLGRLGGLAAR